MPKLSRLDNQPVVIIKTRPGPQGKCGIYGDGDLEDWAEVQRRRLATSWVEAQRAVDRELGITAQIHVDKFRYHWQLRCGHWTDEQRQQAHDEQADQ